MINALYIVNHNLQIPFSALALSTKQKFKQNRDNDYFFHFIEQVASFLCGPNDYHWILIRLDIKFIVDQCDFWEKPADGNQKWRGFDYLNFITKKMNLLFPLSRICLGSLEKLEDFYRQNIVILKIFMWHLSNLQFFDRQKPPIRFWRHFS